MEGNDKKTKRKVKAQELLETNARYSGWLKKFKQGSRKDFQKRYCIIHSGFFYYYVDDFSSTENGLFCLSYYSAKIEVPTSSSELKWQFKIIGTHFSRQREYLFAAGSQRERDVWVTQINEEVAEFYPSSHREAGDGDVAENLLYTEPNEQKNCVFFTDPETASHLTLTVNKPPIAAKPTPPPRPISSQATSKTKRTIKQQMTSSRAAASSNYEVLPDMIRLPSPTCPASATCSTTPDSCPYPSSLTSMDELYLPLMDEADSPEDSGSSPNNSNARSYPHYLSKDVILPRSVFQMKLEKEQASRLLVEQGIEGMYLIRQSKRNENKVISVLIQDIARHYYIFQRMDHNRTLLFLKDEDGFLDLPDLIRYYYANQLPTSGGVLTQPYQ